MLVCDVCVSVCVRKRVCAGIWRTVSGVPQMSSLIFETRSLVVAWSSTRRLGWIVREPWALTLSTSPRLESQMTVTMAGIAMIVIMAGITMIVTVSDFFFYLGSQDQTQVLIFVGQVLH